MCRRELQTYIFDYYLGNYIFDRFFCNEHDQTLESGCQESPEAVLARKTHYIYRMFLELQTCRMDSSAPAALQGRSRYTAACSLRTK